MVQKDDEFAAGVTRDVRIIEAISQTLFTLELIHLAGVTIDGEADVLDLSCEIERLNAALGGMDVEDDDESASRAKLGA